jgi:hypothetical protein
MNLSLRMKRRFKHKFMSKTKITLKKHYSYYNYFFSIYMTFSILDFS